MNTNFLIAPILLGATVFLLRRKITVGTNKSNSYILSLYNKATLVSRPKLKQRNSAPYVKPPKESSREKGEKFKNFVARKFDSNYFSFKDARSDLYINGIYPESNTYPDLLFECKWRSREKLAIECKFRGGWRTNKKDKSKYIKWSYKEQIERYKSYGENQNARVFVVIGIGGYPQCPQDIFIVPLNVLYENKGYLSRNFLMDFRSPHPNYNFFYNMESKFLTQKLIS